MIVNALVLYNSFSDEGWLSDISVEFRAKLFVFFGDVRDQTTVDAAMEGCDAVIHLASLITIPYSYKAPTSYFETNVIGTVNVLSSAKDMVCTELCTLPRARFTDPRKKYRFVSPTNLLVNLHTLPQNWS